MLKGLFGGATSPPNATRLTEAEALALAKEAAGDHWLRNALTVAVAERNADGTVVWTVETGGVGSSLRFVINDATGAILQRVARDGR